MVRKNNKWSEKIIDGQKKWTCCRDVKRLTVLVLTTVCVSNKKNFLQIQHVAEALRCNIMMTDYYKTNI